MNKLNLGCGDDYREGWINVDVSETVRADMYFDLIKKFPFKNNYFDYILAHDIVEHFTKEQAKEFLKECKRVLKVGGKLEIRTPNLYEIFKTMKNSPEDMINYIYGYSDETGEFGAHKYGYTRNTLAKILKSFGLEIVSLKKVTSNHVCIARKRGIKDKRIKLLISQQDAAAIGGAEIFIDSLTTALKKKGVRSEIIIVTNSALTRYYKKRSVSLIEVPYRMNVFGGLRGLIKFVSFLPHSVYIYFQILLNFKKSSGNIILIPGFSDKIVLTPLAKLLNLPVIWLEYSPLEEVFKRNIYAPKILYRAVKKLPDLVIVPSKNTRNHYFAETKIPHHKVMITPLAIYTLSQSQIMKLGREKQKTKVKHGINGATVVGMISRLEEEKGQDTLIVAAKELKKHINDLKVMIVGEGSYKKELERLVNINDLEDIVIFTGPLYGHDKWKMLSTFDVFAFPTRWKLEGFGLVPLEAMMMGVPVVASNFGPVPEVVGDVGVLVEPNSVSLAGGILKVLNNKNLRKRLIKKGKERVTDKFDINNISDKYFEEIKSLINIYSP